VGNGTDLLTGQVTTAAAASRRSRRQRTRRAPGGYWDDFEGGDETPIYYAPQGGSARLGASDAAGGPQATDLGALLRASEGRTMRAFRELREDVRDDWDDLRDEVREAVARTMPTDRILDRWRLDEQRDRQTEAAIAGLQQTLGQLNSILPGLATKADVRAAVAEAITDVRREHPNQAAVERLIDEKVRAGVAGLASPAQVKEIVEAATEKHYKKLLNLVMVALALLGFLVASGLINLPGLFHR
jgi:hypothetical protein